MDNANSTKQTEAVWTQVVLKNGSWFFKHFFRIARFPIRLGNLLSLCSFLVFDKAKKITDMPSLLQHI